MLLWLEDLSNHGLLCFWTQDVCLTHTCMSMHLYEQQNYSICLFLFALIIYQEVVC